jgi:hypothetical protein
MYKTWKNDYQMGLSISGGIHGSLTLVDEMALLLVQYVKDHHHTDYSSRRLEEILRSEIPGGRDMTLKEQEDTAIKTRRLLDEDAKAPEKTPLKHPDFQWESDFTWKTEMLQLIQNHPVFKDYTDIFLAHEVEGLSPYKHARQFEKITGLKKTANNDWITRMNKDDIFQGWLKKMRGDMHENFVAQKLGNAGWLVNKKPHFTLGGIDYEEDLYIENGDRQVWINCKCGSGNRTYNKDEYLTTYILANQAGAEAYILYLDLETNMHDVFFPGQSVSVGSRRSALTSAVQPTNSAPSTPLLLLAALQSPPTDRASSTRSPTKARPKTRPKAKPKPQAKPKARPKAKSRPSRR